ncbi:hypothetical protein ACTXT7_013835 [Hymenolepis weldensis]
MRLLMEWSVPDLTLLFTLWAAKDQTADGSMSALFRLALKTSWCPRREATQRAPAAMKYPYSHTEYK